ncbi:hypothetical protein SCHPADRAFT_1002067 [Schizopora paradoxa]|uniref:Uncharacterized protein n=1 Tax=Schizopora paradoxa TaxID=27342 RepID=A0A0H2R540_9AGAM|nr:hypothetical protein SCHPADRAFT_1002067 [Schizopora paradoxa]
MDVTHVPVAELQNQNTSSSLFILKLKLDGVVYKIRLSISTVREFLVKLVHLDFEFQELAIIYLKPFLEPILGAIYRMYKYCKLKKPVLASSLVDKKRRLNLRWKKFTRWLNICWRKLKRWIWNTFTVGNALDVVGKLLDFANIWKPMPGMLLSQGSYRFAKNDIPDGYVRVKFRWREQNWRRRIGMSTDMMDPWQLSKGPFLIRDFKLESDKSLDLRKVAECFNVDKLEVLSPGRLDAYPLEDSTNITMFGIHTLVVRDGYITVVEHEDNLTRARKVFHQWFRGSLSYCLLRWIVFLSIVGAVFGAVGRLAYNVDWLYAFLLFPIGFVYFQFYAMHMSTKYKFDWNPWPARRARGWVEPRYQKYL